MSKSAGVKKNNSSAGSGIVKWFAAFFQNNRRTGSQQDNLEKKLEDAVDKNRELQSEVERLRQDNQRLMEIDKMRSSFLSLVSHELRTPMTSILGFASLVKREFDRSFLPRVKDDQQLKKTGAKISRNLGIIKHGGWRLTGFIDNVLDLNRIDSGRMQWNDMPVSVQDVISACVQDMDKELENKPDVSLQVDIRNPLPEIIIDEAKLKQVVSNLLSNAVRFTHKGKVEVRVFREGENLKITVRDTGEGIPEEQLENIFDRLHIGVKPEDSKSGPGLGLALCRKIVEHYQGRISVESVPGKGSSFTVLLPLAVAGGKGVSNENMPSSKGNSAVMH